MKQKLLCLALVLVAGGVPGAGQAGVNTPMLDKIRAEEAAHSQIVPVFETLTTDIGPRLTASPAHLRAVDFVAQTLASYGLSNVHKEGWKFGRGWTLEKLTVEMVEPRYLPLVAYADGWSAATSGEIVATPIFVGGRNAADVQAMGATIKGAIVMTAPLMTNFVRKDRPQPSDAGYVPGSAGYATSAGRSGAAPGPGSAPAQATGRGGPGAGTPNAAAPAGVAGGRGRGAGGPTVATVLRDAGAGVLLKPSIGEHGTVFVTGRDGGPGAVPSLTISGEQYNMIARMLEKNIPVKLRINVQTKFYDNDGNAYNVIAEIPGTDPLLRDEVVMIGAHVDSWHTGVGATDNADGTVTMMEAMRILKAIDARPKRTIRLGIWAGEEQGLLGSKAWVDAHLMGDANKTARDKFDVYYNIDNGFGKIYGFYLENNDKVRPLFDAWLDPLNATGTRRNVKEGIGSTDHLSFIAAGVPGFNPIQDYEGYDVSMHHTNMDTVERMDVNDVKQAAIVMAWFAYNSAMADQKIPR
jgi:carboxypeptidase Q